MRPAGLRSKCCCPARAATWKARNLGLAPTTENETLCFKGCYSIISWRRVSPETGWSDRKKGLKDFNAATSWELSFQRAKGWQELAHRFGLFKYVLGLIITYPKRPQPLTGLLGLGVLLHLLDLFVVGSLIICPSFSLKTFKFLRVSLLVFKSWEQSWYVHLELLKLVPAHCSNSVGGNTDLCFWTSIVVSVDLCHTLEGSSELVVLAETEQNKQSIPWDSF